MKVITWLCYCGNKEVESREDGKEEITRETRHVELGCCPDGQYYKSPHYDTSYDKAFEKRVIESQMLQCALKGVKPLKKRGKK